MWFLLVAMALSAVYSGVQQRQAQKQQKASLDAQAENTRQQQQADSHATQEQLAESLREEAGARLDNKRQVTRTASTVMSQQAYTGVNGITSERQLNNVLFQGVLDDNAIQRAGDKQLESIATQGFSSQGQLVSTLNNITAEKSTIKPESYLSIGLRAGLSAGTAYYSTRGLSSGSGASSTVIKGGGK